MTEVRGGVIEERLANYKYQRDGLASDEFEPFHFTLIMTLALKLALFRMNRSTVRTPNPIAFAASFELFARKSRFCVALSNSETRSLTYSVHAVR
jgi:hypothetical protein|tara:strand:- start:1511 stop:1795 length:285 start_codon:yes stop_codon:yes gene_type:complete